MVSYEKFQKEYAKAYPLQVAYSKAYATEAEKFIKKLGRKPSLREAQIISHKISDKIWKRL